MEVGEFIEICYKLTVTDMGKQNPYYESPYFNVINLKLVDQRRKESKQVMIVSYDSIIYDNYNYNYNN